MKWLKVISIVIVHLALWMLFVSDLSARDFIIGLLAVALTSAAFIGVARLMAVQFRPSFHDVAQGWRIPLYAFAGTFEVLEALWKQLFATGGAPSFLAAVPFDPGGEDARSAGRRALAVTYTTITPNFVVLGLVRRGEGGADAFGRDVMLFHQVIPGEVLQMTQNLGARS